MDNTKAHIRTVKKAFGTRLKTIRASLGITQEDLAWKAGFDHTTIWRIENGISDPKLTTICLLASVLDINLRELIDIDINLL